MKVTFKYNQRYLLLVGVLAGLTASCDSGSDSTSDAGSDEVFIAAPSDLCAYPSWTKYVEPDGGGDAIIVADAGDGGIVHAAGGRIEYISKTPPHGSTEFPVGTMIVKTIDSSSQIFAMVKRGGGYNANGPQGQVLNWEWFELAPTDCEAGFIWSGGFPPANQAYGGTPDACNQCHGGFLSNDYVASPKILLKDY